MFKRHEFLVVTVKEWLKLVYFYPSYRKNKSGVPLILDHPVYTHMYIYHKLYTTFTANHTSGPHTHTPVHVKNSYTILSNHKAIPIHCEP